jgi:ATP-dependent DNA helicase RecG
MKTWATRALGLLSASLDEPRHELNELDWKTSLSPDKKRLTEHLSAFANLPGGGFLVFGITDTGEVTGILNPDVQNIIAQLGNLARSALEPVVRLDHKLEDWEGVKILIIHVLDRKQNQLCSGERI